MGISRRVCIKHARLGFRGAGPGQTPAVLIGQKSLLVGSGDNRDTPSLLRATAGFCLLRAISRRGSIQGYLSKSSSNGQNSLARKSTRRGGWAFGWASPIPSHVLPRRGLTLAPLLALRAHFLASHTAFRLFVGLWFSCLPSLICDRKYKYPVPCSGPPQAPLKSSWRC